MYKNARCSELQGAQDPSGAGAVRGGAGTVVHHGGGAAGGARCVVGSAGRAMGADVRAAGGVPGEGGACACAGEGIPQSTAQQKQGTPQNEQDRTAELNAHVHARALRAREAAFRRRPAPRHGGAGRSDAR